MITLRKTTLAIGVSMALVPMASADVLSLDISDIDSWDGPGLPDNDTLEIDLAAALGLAPNSSVTVTGIGWDVVISTVGASWLSEVAVGLEGFDFTPAGGDYGFGLGAGDFPGTMEAFTSGGILSFVGDFALPDLVLSDGILNVEFFESYDDVAGAVDAMFDAGSELSFEFNATIVPIPAAFPLLATGLAGLFIGARRRRVS